MALVAVVDLLLDAHGPQGADAAQAEQQLLFEPVLPVAAVEVVGDLTVFVEIGFVVGVEQEEVGAADLASPDAGRERTPRQGDLYGRPVAQLVAHGRNRQLREVLRLVGRLLRPLRREPLREVAVTVEQPHGNHRHVLVRRLFEVVAGEDAQAARIDLQRRVQSVFHREVGDRRRLRIGFFAHVFVEHGVDAVEHRKERTVLFQLLQPFERQPVEEYDRVLLALRPQLLVDVLEQVAGAAGPAPPKVVREHFEGVETLGKHLLDHHAVPVRFFGDELLPHEIDLFGRAASVVEHRTVGTGHRTFDRFGIGFFVGCVEFAPQGRARQFGGGVAGDFDLLRGIFGEMQQRLGDFASCFGVVVVVACDERHALVFALRTGPESESGQRGGERRYREGRRLERRVSPRLVVRGEERHVHSHQQFVVALVEDAVAAVEVGGDEDHLHLRRRVGQHAAGDRVEDLIPFGMFEIVGAEAVLLGIDRAVFVGQMRLQILAGAGRGGRYGDVDQHLAVEGVRFGELFQGVEEDVDAFVAEFVAAARADDQGFAVEFAAQRRLGRADHRAACLGPFFVELPAVPHEVVLEAVGGDDVHRAAQQALAFAGGDFAHGAEHVVFLRGDLLDRVFGHDVELARQFAGVEPSQILVERQPVAGHAAARHRGVGREDRRHVGRVLAQVESAGGGHPLVEVGHHLVRRGAEVLHVGGDDLSGRVAEEHRLDVVPLSRDRIDVVGLPQEFQDVVLLREERRIVDQHRDRTADDAPAADADADAVVVDALAPRFEQLVVLLEFGIVAFALDVGADEQIVVAQFAFDGAGLGRNDGVDAADFVADLPAHLEEVVGRQQFVFVHILSDF